MKLRDKLFNQLTKRHIFKSINGDELVVTWATDIHIKKWHEYLYSGKTKHKQLFEKA